MKNIFYKTLLFYIKFECRMFLALIWYAYCACKSKIWIFQKIVLLKTKKFLCKTNELQGSLTKKLRKKGLFSMILKVNKDASFHIRPFLFDFYEIWQWIRMIKRNVPLWSPPPYRSTKKPILIRVNRVCNNLSCGVQGVVVQKLFSFLQR